LTKITCLVFETEGKKANMDVRGGGGLSNQVHVNYTFDPVFFSNNCRDWFVVSLFPLSRGPIHRMEISTQERVKASKASHYLLVPYMGDCSKLFISFKPCTSIAHVAQGTSTGAEKVRNSALAKNWSEYTKIYKVVPALSKILLVLQYRPPNLKFGWQNHLRGNIFMIIKITGLLQPKSLHITENNQRATWFFVYTQLQSVMEDSRNSRFLLLVGRRLLEKHDQTHDRCPWRATYKTATRISWTVKLRLGRKGKRA
jgi:hypothetical protein